MNRYRNFLFSLITVLAAAVTITVGLGAVNNNPDGPVNNLSDSVFSRVQIMQFQNKVARFDTSTGAVQRFNGSLSPSNANGTWISFVQPVTTTTSGFLQIQEVDDATFLVDVVSGDTWILRRQGNIGSWRKVNILGGGS